MFNEHIENAINSLCDWIINKTKNGASSEELKVLPEVTKSLSELICSTKN